MIEFKDITSLSRLLESFTIGLGVASISICSSFSKNSSVNVMVGVEAIIVEFEVE
jgi:hypothetical protein